MAAVQRNNDWGTGNQCVGPRKQIAGVPWNSLRTRMLDSHVAICIQCMIDFWISTMSIQSLQDAFPHAHVLMHFDSKYSLQQLWVLAGGFEHVNDWNLWDVYDWHVIQVHWTVDGNANSEIGLRYTYSYWWAGVYESPSQD